MSRTQTSSVALVLHVRDTKEADRYVTLLTPEFGRLDVSAKGVRRLHSKRGAAIHPGNVVRCSWVGRGEWNTLTEVVSVEHLFHPPATLERIRDFSVILEIVYHLSLAGAEQAELFDQAVSLLRAVGQHEEYNRGWVRQQLLELAASQGMSEESPDKRQSVTQLLETALERPLRSFPFLSVE